ncbi:hypothetical protein SUGI_0673530 [Cryptomeria japonica]|uniref:uncharacterized protein LOC131056233 n=1 Tax=Cryptomeria japonica TaxID=3369 RepID=UPI002414941C|nr:uncharacterized protein LOC131056233 [Cryptomeria japonica]XP_059065158.1 uncharacterized protein LOC131056233 [Cryptomeria japonica]GLJ33478.1 hypothetical protein SUGI_0673530 [Cryptomeria japonica]
MEREWKREPTMGGRWRFQTRDSFTYPRWDRFDSWGIRDGRSRHRQNNYQRNPRAINNHLQWQRQRRVFQKQPVFDMCGSESPLCKHCTYPNNIPIKGNGVPFNPNAQKEVSQKMNKDPRRLIDRYTNHFPNVQAEWENQRKLHPTLQQAVHSEGGDHSKIIGNGVSFNSNAQKEASQKMNKDSQRLFDRNTNRSPNGQAGWENQRQLHPILHQVVQPESGDHSIFILERMINAQVEDLKSRALIGKIVDFVPDQNFICQWVGKNWEGVTDSFCIDNGEGFFMVLFEDNESRDRIHRKKDWFIAGRGLITQIWYPNFIPSQSFCSIVPVWISFPSLPLEYRDT